VRRGRSALLGILVLLVALAAAAGSASSRPLAARAAPHKMLLGLMDDGLLSGQTDVAFTAIQQLHPQVIRYDADWPTIALRRPAVATNPADPAYDFGKLDEIVLRAHALGIPVLLSIVHTPAWDGGTAKHNHMPRSVADLQAFSYAVAFRYSGHYARPDGTLLPPVTMWTAWNEPNTRTHLSPQWQCVSGKLPGATPCLGGRGHYIAVSPRLYNQLLGAIYRGVHAVGARLGLKETVAGGVTKPVGAGPLASEPSVAPITFVKALGQLHAVFDVYAHHPYRGRPGQVLTGNNVGFDGLGRLFAQLDASFPGKHYHLWITEYGAQTNPPDSYVGVTPAVQATMLRANVLAARANPRIDMLIWFLIRDQAINGPFAAGFQSGLAYVSGRPKPAWATFQSLAR
jgi:hypothetical protein